MICNRLKEENPSVWTLFRFRQIYHSQELREIEGTLASSSEGSV